MVDDDKKCAHAPCQCKATNDSKYCREYCEDVEKSGVVEIVCGCAHSACHI